MEGLDPCEETEAASCEWRSGFVMVETPDRPGVERSRGEAEREVAVSERNFRSGSFAERCSSPTGRD
eukprot:6485529-Pyramimonas_sp.AAC.1